MRRPDSATIFTALLLVSLLAPTVLAAASLQLAADSLAKEATTDDPAEYAITIINNGDEDLTVSLSTSQASDCNGFTSSIDTVPFSLNEGDSEEKTLSVSVNDQASGECETTVTATGAYPGGTADADIKVTTSAEGGGQYSVTLTHNDPGNGIINYDGEDDNAKWTVDVENSGEQDNQNIQLSMTSSSDCDSDGLDATVDPQTMTLNSGESEEATVTVDLPAGSSTESGNHCFILEATMTSDPNPTDQANDSIPLTLKIQEVKTCDSSLGSSSHTLDPGESADNFFSLVNTGNTAWTVSAFAMAEGYDISDWVDFETPTSRLLSETGGNQDSTTFDFVITPDDSMEPGSIDVYIQGRAGSNVGCESLLRVNLGQVRDASLSLTQPTLSNIQPGASASTSIQITNTGNGQDTYALGVKDLLPGWHVELSQTTITVNGRHCTTSLNCDREYVQAQITVPANGKAGIEFPIMFTVSSSGLTHDEAPVVITVSPVHSASMSLTSDSQTGRFTQWVAYPIDLTNTGNIQDSFGLSSCDPDINDTCEQTKWSTRFKDSGGNDVTLLTIDSEHTKRIYLEVLVSDNIDNKSEKFEVRIGIVGTEILLTDKVTTTVSIYNYSMAVAFESPDDDPALMSLALPPGGTSSLSFWISNTGDGGADEVVVSVSGMDSSVLRTISVDGSQVEGDIRVPADDRVLVEIEFEVLEGIESGVSGVLRIGVTSKKNTAQTPSFVDIAVDIRTIHDLRFTLESPDEKESTYPEHSEFILYVSNYGNTEEDVEVLSSDSLRGWTVDVINDEFKLDPGETREVKVRVTPPSEMIDDDDYTFTITVQPKDLPVAGQPVDLTARSTLGLGSISDEMQEVLAIAVILVGSLLVLYLFVRSRSENRLLAESLYDENDD
ncbi:MAG: hypothetical protein QGH57_00535 [Candidatus Thalassarchaeaceae archaeon]|nr:hypothetical protein [Candidatus Thalassarchaeaceae archaeon]MDP7649639.1 hypothetical protein [Candidatus Thalassarchaeaceae archaeon]|tara:strand:+ start:5879 stop:8560 length:2682 start_codon:yes stop_codon:yes gene_type:complete